MAGRRLDTNCCLVLIVLETSPLAERGACGAPPLHTKRKKTTLTYEYIYFPTFHTGTLLHSKFNTQLLTTVSNSSRILTHVQLLLAL
jgi:hypothetical protein